MTSRTNRSDRQLKQRTNNYLSANENNARELLRDEDNFAQKQNLPINPPNHLPIPRRSYNRTKEDNPPTQKRRGTQHNSHQNNNLHQNNSHQNNNLQSFRSSTQRQTIPNVQPNFTGQNYYPQPNQEENFSEEEEQENYSEDEENYNQSFISEDQRQTIPNSNQNFTNQDYYPQPKENFPDENYSEDNSEDNSEEEEEEEEEEEDNLPQEDYSKEEDFPEQEDFPEVEEDTPKQSTDFTSFSLGQHLIDENDIPTTSSHNLPSTNISPQTNPTNIPLPH